MENEVKYAIGEQNFEKIRTMNFLYVDKTMYIHKMMNSGSRYYFLARPRRFGKSLFLSTLQYFFEGRRDLFKGLYIDSTDWKWEKYPVLHLDFNKERYAEPGLLEEILENTFDNWDKDFGINTKGPGYTSRFENILRILHKKTGKQVIILVDEYDKPLVGNINKDNNFEHYRSKLAALYSNFKSCTEHIQLVFLTGVSRFSKLSVFSDLNNLNDITFNDKFADICGITRDELTKYFRQGIDKLAATENISREEAIELLKNNYDGYRFTASGSDIYNPWSLLNAMDSSKIEDYWNETGLPTIAGEALKRVDADLEETFDSYCKMTDLKGLDLLNPNPTALLFQTGYLTIKGYDRESRNFHLGLPNREVKRGLYNVLVPFYVKNRKAPGNRLINEAVRNFIIGNPDKAMMCLQTYFAGIYYALRIENENNFHNAFYLLMNMMGLDTLAESHTSAGRIDIEIKTNKYIYIIELKYDHSAEEALHQIEERHYARKYQNENREVVLIGTSFSSTTRCIESWIIKSVFSPH